MELVLCVLERFGVINPYTTNDVTPTLLYLVDCPIPAYAVGSVMIRSLSKELKDARAVRYQAYRYERDKVVEGYSEESEQQVVDRLRALGYVD
jgi:hypothetical protein